jgi:hypothetical protein
MKHLLIGVVAAATLAISQPVWAQQAAPAAPATTTGSEAASAKHVGSPTRAHHRRHAVQAAMNPSAGSSADQLNRDELSHFQSMNQMPAGGPPTSSRGTH